MFIVRVSVIKLLLCSESEPSRVSTTLTPTPASVAAHPGDVSTFATWSPSTPARGAVLVLPGRGDAAAHYRRLGERLSFDGYAVFVPEFPIRSAADVARAWRESGVGAGFPIAVLLGVDVAASFAALAITNGSVTPTALVLAGATSHAAEGAADPDDAAQPFDAAAGIALRTACPVHSALLHSSPAVALHDDDRTDDWPSAATSIDLPTLILHGAADRVSAVAGVLARTSTWPARELVSVLGGAHDVLNDVAHRTVAAEIIAFAERLRIAGTAPAIVIRRSAGDL
jgi:pimeloyl-ACP methyl ester carboxylesterase